MNTFFLNLFIYFWLCWVFVSVRGLSLVVASGGHSSSQCTGLSLSRPLLLRSTGSRCAGSVVVAHGPSCSAACGILPDQGSNPCPLHWQADSQPLRHQRSPRWILFEQTIQDLANKIPCSISWQRIHYVPMKGTSDMYFFCKETWTMAADCGTGKLLKVSEGTLPGERNIHKTPRDPWGCTV